MSLTVNASRCVKVCAVCIPVDELLKNASQFNEGLSNPQQAAGGGLLHDAIVVSGVHPRARKLRDVLRRFAPPS